jgi:hypothetical protein
MAETKKKSLARRLLDPEEMTTTTLTLRETPETTIPVGPDFSEQVTLPAQSRIEPVSLTARGQSPLIAGIADFLTAFGAGPEAAQRQQAMRRQITAEDLQRQVEAAEAPMRAKIQEMQFLQAQTSLAKSTAPQYMQIGQNEWGFVNPLTGSVEPRKVSNAKEAAQFIQEGLLNIQNEQIRGAATGAANAMLSTNNISGAVDVLNKAISQDSSERRASMRTNNEAAAFRQMIAQGNLSMRQREFAARYLGIDSRTGQPIPGAALDEHGNPIGFIPFRTTGPTSTSRARAEFAGALAKKVPGIKESIVRLGKAGKLGPIAGRYEDFMAGTIGLGDPDFARLRAQMSLLETGLMVPHVGARGGVNLIERFKAIFNFRGATPEMLIAVVDEAEQFLHGYATDLRKMPPNTFTPEFGLGQARPIVDEDDLFGER